MRELFSQLDKVAQSSAPVLIQGETGTGKELAARAIHEASARAQEPFVVVDCGALPESVVEAELFGHGRGAFTGAVQNRCGAFEAAHAGTIFLDEIGELPLAVQPKLLRVLESRSVRRIGESVGREVDVRVICATHRNLARMVSAGAFREDLYFRLAVLPATLPPLRERPEDIPLLVHRFLEGRAVEGLELEELVRCPWLGNVRELRNLVERACTLGAREAMSVSTAMEPDSPTDATALKSPVSFALDYRDFRERWVEWGEQEYVKQLLERHDFNVAQAARSAGINRTYLYRLLKKHAL
jgi:transcriptional regulator with GAF, ATPase, and Fis domain